MKLFDLFKRKKNTPQKAVGPVNKRAYIIGDVHGCFHQLKALISLIEADCLVSESDVIIENYIVFLGDLIDRGPDSKAVIDFLVTYNPRYGTPVYLSGNHEDIFLNVMNGDTALLKSWFDHGGRDCARSYGVDNLGVIHYNPNLIIKQLQRKVPLKHVEFIKSFENYWKFGGYLCVHAGVKPNLSLEKQSPRDLKWIREPFLSHKKHHEYIIVHGHTIVPEVEFHDNRIAVDTGAYLSGALSCLVINGESNYTLTTK